MQLSNIDMEASVLGSILSNNELLYKVLDILRECGFTDILTKKDLAGHDRVVIAQ